MEITDAFPASAKALMLVFSQMSSEIFGLCDMITCNTNRLCMFTSVLVTLSHPLWWQNSLKNKTFETTYFLYSFKYESSVYPACLAFVASASRDQNKGCVRLYQSSKGTQLCEMIVFTLLLKSSHARKSRKTPGSFYFLLGEMDHLRFWSLGKSCFCFDQ